MYFNSVIFRVYLYVYLASANIFYFHLFFWLIKQSFRLFFCLLIVLSCVCFLSLFWLWLKITWSHIRLRLLLLTKSILVLVRLIEEDSHLLEKYVRKNLTHQSNVPFLCSTQLIKLRTRTLLVSPLLLLLYILPYKGLMVTRTLLGLPWTLF